jgi:hypothetical protein
LNVDAHEKRSVKNSFTSLFLLEHLLLQLLSSPPLITQQKLAVRFMRYILKSLPVLEWHWQYAGFSTRIIRRTEQVFPAEESSCGFGEGIGKDVRRVGRFLLEWEDANIFE